jgi:hypothetical protein
MLAYSPINLNTLASQGQWVNLADAYIQFAVRVRVYYSSGSSQTPTYVGVLSRLRLKMGSINGI